MYVSYSRQGRQQRCSINKMDPRLHNWSKSAFHTTRNKKNPTADTRSGKGDQNLDVRITIINRDVVELRKPSHLHSNQSKSIWLH